MLVAPIVPASTDAPVARHASAPRDASALPMAMPAEHRRQHRGERVGGRRQELHQDAEPDDSRGRARRRPRPPCAESTRVAGIASPVTMSLIRCQTPPQPAGGRGGRAATRRDAGHHQVQRRGQKERALDADAADEDEAGQQRPGQRAGRVHRVERAEPGARGTRTRSARLSTGSVAPMSTVGTSSTANEATKRPAVSTHSESPATADSGR